MGLQKNWAGPPGLCDCPDGMYMPTPPPCDCEDFSCDYLSYCVPNEEVAITNEIKYLLIVSFFYLIWVNFNLRFKRLIVNYQQKIK